MTSPPMSNANLNHVKVTRKQTKHSMLPSSDSPPTCPSQQQRSSLGPSLVKELETAKILQELSQGVGSANSTSATNAGAATNDGDYFSASKHVNPVIRTNDSDENTDISPLACQKVQDNQETQVETSRLVVSPTPSCEDDTRTAQSIAPNSTFLHQYSPLAAPKSAVNAQKKRRRSNISSNNDQGRHTSQLQLPNLPVPERLFPTTTSTNTDYDADSQSLTTCDSLSMSIPPQSSSKTTTSQKSNADLGVMPSLKGTISRALPAPPSIRCFNNFSIPTNPKPQVQSQSSTTTSKRRRTEMTMPIQSQQQLLNAAHVSILRNQMNSKHTLPLNSSFELLQSLMRQQQRMSIPVCLPIQTASSSQSVPPSTMSSSQWSTNTNIMPMIRQNVTSNTPASTTPWSSNPSSPITISSLSPGHSKEYNPATMTSLSELPICMPISIPDVESSTLPSHPTTNTVKMFLGQRKELRQHNTNMLLEKGKSKKTTTSTTIKTNKVKKKSNSTRKRKICKMDMCYFQAAERTPYCTKHAGQRKCEHSTCTKFAQGKTRYCIAHGGGRRCVIPNCNRGARDQNFCAAHGGGRRCTIDSCTKLAVGKGDTCTAHGGGRRCQVGGCKKSAQSSSDYCVRHGGGKKCIFHGCDKVARGKIGMCMAHATLSGVTIFNQPKSE